MGARNAWVLTAAITLGFAAAAPAHIERASYWPDPKPDTSVTPPAGGKVPTPRSLASAVASHHLGTVRVVCQAGSMSRLKSSIADAVKHGYDIRPHDHRTFSKAQGARLLAVNAKLARLCKYHEIQPAITASHNDDRVVVMPGLYLEPTARKQPTNDPKCADLKITNDRGDSTAVSYAYQLKCPNDQNLVAVMGRANGPGKDPAQPRPDRHGIPNLGKCIRCNFQLEGSGVNADDVIVEAGDPRAGNGGPGPKGTVKDVGIRVDRADGFVLRNLTVRHAREHDIYVLESDGFVADRFKTYYAGEYGILTFVEDHGLISNCEAAGNGDSGLYPGASAETGFQGVAEKYEPKVRYGERITHCDSHHNTLGYSGTDGNAVHIDHNNFYDNTEGWSTDIFTASGHPGFPQDSDLVDHNNFFSNNFDTYDPNADVKPSVPVPIGVGAWIAGGNHNTFKANRFYDNWRRGTMLFAVPDSFVCTQPDDNNLHGCDPSKIQTSFSNVYTANIMGIAPDGTYMPNGTDFWWDSFPGNTGNCWFSNTPYQGKSISTSPSSLPDCGGGKDPSASTGTGDPANEQELLGCAAAAEDVSKSACPWFTTPPKPSRR
jgi:hypothetical protein